jgi:hypothetical protein
MFALIAVVLSFLCGFGVIEDTENVTWIFVILAFVAMELAVPTPVPLGRWRRE